MASSSLSSLTHADADVKDRVTHLLVQLILLLLVLLVLLVLLSLGSKAKKPANGKDSGAILLWLLLLLSVRNGTTPTPTTSPSPAQTWCRATSPSGLCGTPRCCSRRATSCTSSRGARCSPTPPSRTPGSLPRSSRPSPSRGRLCGTGSIQSPVTSTRTSLRTSTPSTMWGNLSTRFARCLGIALSCFTSSFAEGSIMYMTPYTTSTRSRRLSPQRLLRVHAHGGRLLRRAASRKSGPPLRKEVFPLD